MKKLLYFFAVMVVGVLSSNAQPLSIGSTVKDLELKDINGNSIKLSDYLDKGYTVLVDISATWCGPCWNFERSNVGQTLYDHYGPEGTVTPGKIMFLFIEGDIRTKQADLLGNTSSSQGDWVTGKTHPIVDATTNATILHFLQPGAENINFPTFLLICPDYKVIWTGEGFNASWSESFFVDKTGTCGAEETTGIGQAAPEQNLTSAVYPNPAIDQVYVDLNIKEQTTAVLTISNMLGQEVMKEQIKLVAGLQTQSVQTATLSKGMYILTVTTADHTSVQHKFLKD